MTDEYKKKKAAALKLFDGYFADNYPGPNTIISNPHWHAPKIFTAALACLSGAGFMLVEQPAPQPTDAVAAKAATSELFKKVPSL
jgi:hypothetical protein